MVLVCGVVGAVDVAAGGEELCGASTEELVGGFGGGCAFRGTSPVGGRRRVWEFPFGECHVFGDGVDIGRTDGDGGCGEGVGAEKAFGC